jgi:hypothetical protein
MQKKRIFQITRGRVSPGPLSSRAERRDRREMLEYLYSSLEHDVHDAAMRFGIDIYDELTIKKLISAISNKLPENAHHEEYVFHFIALAYAQILVIEGNEYEAEVIDALCTGNRVIGFLNSMPKQVTYSGLCIDCVVKAHTSRIGKAGAEKKLAPLKELQRWAVEKYQSKSWPSANKAAFDLKDEIIAYGRTINVTLAEQNAQRTIATWFRKKPTRKSE